MILTDKMHDAVANSEVGKFIDRLIREESNRGGNCHVPGGGGSVIQMLWAAFMSGQEEYCDKCGVHRMIDCTCNDVEEANQ